MDGFNNNQNYQVDPAYQQPSEKKVFGIISLICGILSILCCWVPVLNWILNLGGIICGIVSLVKHEDKKGLAIAGIICSSLGIIVCIILIVASASLVSMIPALESLGY